MISGMIIEGRSKRTLLPNVMKTESCIERMKGLLGRTALAEGEGLLIEPCNSVHTFFMKISIDIVFLNAENEVVKIKSNLKPWRMTIKLRAASVLELARGQAEKSGLRQGDYLLWEQSA